MATEQDPREKIPTRLKRISGLRMDRIRNERVRDAMQVEHDIIQDIQRQHVGTAC